MMVTEAGLEEYRQYIQRKVPSKGNVGTLCCPVWGLNFTHEDFGYHSLR